MDAAREIRLGSSFSYLSSFSSQCSSSLSYLSNLAPHEGLVPLPSLSNPESLLVCNPAPSRLLSQFSFSTHSTGSSCRLHRHVNHGTCSVPSRAAAFPVQQTSERCMKKEDENKGRTLPLALRR